MFSGVVILESIWKLADECSWQNCTGEYVGYKKKLFVSLEHDKTSLKLKKSTQKNHSRLE